MKLKIERYYNLGVSLSKCLGLFECVNFVQYLLNLLEEYEHFVVTQNNALKTMELQLPAVNPIVARFVMQPVHSMKEIKKQDAFKREVYS